MPDSDTDNDREEYLSRLGVVLELARKTAGYSQEKAADKMGVNVGTFTRWENGANGISAYDLIRLVRLYDFDAELVINPPASKVAVKAALSDPARLAAAAARRAIQEPLDDGDSA